MTTKLCRQGPQDLIKYTGTTMQMKLRSVLRHSGLSDLRFVSFPSVKQSEPHAQFICLPVCLQILIAWERSKLPAFDPGIYAANLISV